MEQKQKPIAASPAMNRNAVNVEILLRAVSRKRIKKILRSRTNVQRDYL